MAKGRLYKDTHRLGYNTRDNPQDVSTEACRAMVNCFPGHPSCFPRDGFAAWNSAALAATPSYQFPWADATEPKVILTIGTSFYWKKAGAGAETQFGTAAVIPSGAKLSAFRVKDMLYVNTDQTGVSHKAWIISWNGTTFALRNANIAQPNVGLTVTATPGANMANGKWRNYGVTFVNRNDTLSKDGSSDPLACDLQNISTEAGFNPGLLESVENIEQRFAFENGSGGPCAPHINLALLSGSLDAQITHARIWVTQEGDSEDEVTGFTLRWLADIPVKGAHSTTSPWQWDDFTTPGEIAGDEDLLKTTGYEDMPPGTYMRFHQSRLWVGGVGSSEEIGRNFYSETIQDVDFPVKWFSMFKLGTLYKDTSYEDSEPGVGIGVANNDLYFFGKRGIFYLRDGDPTFEPARIGGNKGTSFPNSITALDDEIAFLSNQGPATCANRQIRIVEEHTAGEVWPKLHDNSVGYFHGLTDKTKVYGFFYRQHWFLTDGVKLIGFSTPSEGMAGGPWTVEPGDASIGFGLPCVLDPEELCVMTSDSAAAPKLWHFLKKGVSQDNGAEYWLKSASKAFYVNPKDRDRSGELYLLRVFSHFEDSAPLFITIKSDFFRFVMEFTYSEESESSLISPYRNTAFREILELPIPEGFVGAFFEVEWRKLHRTPFKFNNKGWALEYRPVEGQPIEFVSASQGDGLMEEFPDTLLFLKLDDDSDTARDFSMYARDHAYSAGVAGSRAFAATLVPGGGQRLVGSFGSGYADADWDGMDGIGDSAGLNSTDHSYEYEGIIPTLASGQVFQEAGDGVNYWRFRANADGSLEYQIHTSALSYKFTTPAAAVVAGSAQYFLQFILTDGGLTGQFYVQRIDGDLVVPATTRSIL